MTEAASPPVSGVGWWGIIKQAGADWVEDKSTKLAAALAFYTMLSIAPLLLISIKIVGWMSDGEAAKKQIENYVLTNVGTEGWKAIEPMLQSAKDDGGPWVAAASIGILLFSASGVFGELQDSLNTIWEVKPRPNRGILGTIKDRFFSLSLVLGVAFLLLVSLVVSTVLSGLSNHLGGGESVFWQAVNFAISLVVITGLFAAIFKYLPDVRTPWRPALVGAVVTAILFTIGKYLLSWYLGKGSTTSVYGAAGSLVALLLWVYYSAQILFFGAEFTQAYARSVYGATAMQPTANAVKVTEEDRAQIGLASPQRVARKIAEQDSPRRRFVAPPMGLSPSSRRPPSYAAAGVAALVGAAVGALGVYQAKTAPSRLRVAAKVDDRLHAIELKLGRVSRLKGYLDGLSVSDRIDQVDKRLRHATTTLRAQNTGRPRWMVRLGELVAGG